MEKVSTSLYKLNQPLIWHTNDWLCLYNDEVTFSIVMALPSQYPQKGNRWPTYILYTRSLSLIVILICSQSLSTFVFCRVGRSSGQLVLGPPLLCLMTSPILPGCQWGLCTFIPGRSLPITFADLEVNLSNHCRAGHTHTCKNSFVYKRALSEGSHASWSNPNSTLFQTLTKQYSELSTELFNNLVPNMLEKFTRKLIAL